MAAAALSVAEVKGKRRKERKERRRRENGPAHQMAPFMRRDALLPQKAAYSGISYLTPYVSVTSRHAAPPIAKLPKRAGPVAFSELLFSFLSF
jgi:hypothetical protein